MVITPAEYETFKKAVARVQSLEAKLKKLVERLKFVEQRVGLAELNSRKLRPSPVSQKLLTLRALHVTHPMDKPKKRDLKTYLKQFDSYVITYWATWCKPCTSLEELAHLKKLQKQLARHNIGMVSVVIDDLNKALAHPKASKWIYPLWFKRDAHLEMLPREFIAKVGVNLPLFLVVSRTGDIRYFYNDALSDGAVRDLVTAVAKVCRL